MKNKTKKMAPTGLGRPQSGCVPTPMNPIRSKERERMRKVFVNGFIVTIPGLFAYVFSTWDKMEFRAVARFAFIVEI
jgi:hypothetical protein